MVNVFTQDIQRALDFYQGALGLTGSFRTPTEGLPEHVELTVSGFDDVDATFDAVTAAGASPLTAPHNAGNNNRNAAVRGPHGTLVELVAKRS